MNQHFSRPTAGHSEPEVLLSTSGDITRKHAVATHAYGLFTCVLTIYLTTFLIAGITLSNDKVICEYRGESHVADRGSRANLTSETALSGHLVSGPNFQTVISRITSIRDSY
jgi:hypothetical protein